MHGDLPLDAGPAARARALLRAVRLTTIALAFGASCTDSTTRPTSPEVLNGVAAIASGDITAKGAFTQCQNKNAGPSCNWVTGTLNAVHSAYRESEVIPFKLLIKSATTSGADAVHSITLTYGFQKASSQVNANYDFQARYDATLGSNANPCLDTSNLMNPFCTNGALKGTLTTAETPFPAPTAQNTSGLLASDLAKLQAAFTRFTTGQGKTASLVIYGGNFTGIAQPISNVAYFGTSDPSGNTIEARVTFTFRATSSDVLLLWGQHFAAGLDWQNNGAPVINGAAGQSGSPFHVVLEQLDATTIGGKALNVSGDVIQLDPGAKIELSPLSATNSIGESHTVTVTVSERTDASLPWSPAVGETVSFSFSPSGAAILNAAASTCDDVPATDANGQCTIVFSSNTAGTITIHAQSSVSVSGTTTLASSGTGGNNSGDALKTFVEGTLAWNKVDGASALLGGAVFTVCRTENWDSDLNAGAGGYTDIADVCFDVTDNVSGTDNTSASPTDREGDAGKFQLGGLRLGKYTITEKTAPTGYTKDTDVENASLSPSTPSVTIATAFVNPRPAAKISIAGQATNGIGESHTFTVTLQKDLGAGGGFVAASGEHVDVTLSNGGGASYSIDAAASSCDNAGANTDSNGQCTIVFSSNSAGTVTGSASASLTVGGVALSVNTGGAGVATPGSSANVVKTFVAGSLRWLKKDGLGALLGGAVFTVCRTEVWDSDAAGYSDIDPDVCFDVTDNVSADNTSAPPADRDGTAGEFELGGLILGKYSITEKTPPAGYIKDGDPEYASLSTSSPSATIATAFVNISPDAFITIGPATATNDVGEAHTFTAVMTVDPKGGPAPVIDAITIGVSPTPSTLNATSCQAQTGPDGGGKYSRTCTRQINSASVGTFTANATGTATVAGATLTRDTDPATANIGAGTGGSGPATKTYVAPILSLTKTPDDVVGSKQPGDSAIFTITVSNSAQATGDAKNVQILDTLPNPAPGLTWVERTDKAECAITVIDVDPGAPVVNGQLLACNTIGTLTPGQSFTIQVAALIPSGFLLNDPAPSGDAIEIDGDLQENAVLAGADWASLPASVFSCGATKVGCDIDLATGANDNSFGQGAKEDTPVPTVVAGSIPNNKSDLLRLYVAHQRFVNTDFLYLAWSRVQEPNGTTNMDFELNQSQTLSANGFTPVRTANDLLIRYELARGGTDPTILFNRWVTATSAQQLGLGSPAQACEAANAFPCWGKTVIPQQDVTVQAAINTGGVQELGSADQLSAFTFGEASINLQASGIFTPGQCLNFGSAYLKSRSSDAFNSELKDFIAPIAISVPSCTPKSIVNTARARASNFAPAGGAMNDYISNVGTIIVVEAVASNTTLSPSSQHLAMSRDRGALWVRRGGDDE